MTVNRTDQAELLGRQQQAADISNILSFPKHKHLSIHVPLFLKAALIHQHGVLAHDTYCFYSNFLKKFSK